jgi:quercetin dioxygenase-like cupin family protein
MPDSLKWTPVNGISGAWQANVYGDPTAAGTFYTVRMKLSDGTKIPIHWHSSNERVTVLSGNLMVGVGDSVDMASMKTLGPGSFVYIPATLHHYAMAKGDTMIQISGPGPMTLNVVK